MSHSGFRLNSFSERQLPAELVRSDFFFFSDVDSVRSLVHSAGERSFESSSSVCEDMKGVMREKQKHVADLRW